MNLHAWRARIILRRAIVQRAILISTFASLLLAMSAITILATYAQAVPEAGLRATLRDAPAVSTGVKVSTSLGGHSITDLDSGVRDAVRATFHNIPTSIYLAAESIAHDTSDGQIVELVDLQGVAEHADLVSGTWPSDGAPVQLAVPESVAAPLGWTAGTHTQLTSRLSGQSVDVVVSGVYRARNAEAAYWLVDPFGNTGVRQLSLTTRGPVVVTQGAFLDHFADSATLTWQVIPDLSRVTHSQIQALKHALPALRTNLIERDGFGASTSYATNLPTVIDAQQRAAAAARSTLLIPLALLAVLAVSALLLPARLIADYRRGETEQLRARGASPRTITGLALREGALLVVPAGILAALLTSPLVQLVARLTGLRSAGVELPATPGGATWLALAAGALLCLAVFVLPWLRAGRDAPVRQRAAGSTGLQRAGLDAALAVLALVAYWEIRTVSGTGDDPVVVIAPALAVVAGAMVAMRLLPLLARGIERLALRGRGMPAAVASAQVARRPSRHTGPALLVALALAIGTLSAVYGTTWHASQRDRADFQVGADVRFDTPLAKGAVSPAGQRAVYEQLPGVRSALPVLRREAAESKDRSLVVLGVDAAAAPHVMAWRSDLRPASLLKLLAPLAEARPEIPGAPIPPGATGIEVDARLAVTYDEGFTGTGSSDYWNAQLALVVADPDGMLHRVPLGKLPSDGLETTLRGELPSSDQPWTIAAFDLTYSPLGMSPTPTLDLTIGTPRVAGDGSVAPMALPPGMTWSGSAVVDAPTQLPPQVIKVAEVGKAWLSAQVDAGSAGMSTSRSHVLLGLGLPLPPNASAGRTSDPSPIPAIATSSYLRQRAASVGSTIVIPYGGRQLPVTVIASVDAIPAVPNSSDGILLDLQTLNLTAFSSGWELVNATEWWLATDGSGRAREALEADPMLAAAVHDRHQAAEHQWQDPFARGAQTALLVGFAAAILFAAIGFAVNAAIAARERQSELALLRAIGTPPSKVTRLIAVEQTIVVGLGATAGLSLGALVAREVLPLIIISPDGAAAPAVLVALPWPALGLLLAGSILGLLAVTAVLARTSARGSSARPQSLGAE